jgi:hypothetical protein
MPAVTQAKGHRHTRSAALPPSALLPHNPQNPHHLESQAQALNAESEMDSSPAPTTPPRTPRRNNHTQPASHKATPTGPATGSKKKPRNQRPKNVTTSSSPALTRNSRTTPPLPGAQSAGLLPPTKPVSTPSTAAYAGPTFHASPAPSTLPIPSFYSKSVPDSPGLRKFMKDSPLSQKPPMPNSTVSREESPLDIFFKADKEEKARARSASSTTQTTIPSSGPFPPPSASPQTNLTPISASQSSVRRAANRISSGGIFAMELDGESSPSAPIGPAFSTPYSERINAARTAGSEMQPREMNQTMNSEALKAYLFSGHQLPSPALRSSSSDGPITAPVAFRSPAASGATRNSGTPSKNQSYGASVRTSGLRQEVSPTTTPTKTPDRVLTYANSPTPVRRYGTSSSSNKPMGNHTPQATSPLPSSSFGMSSGTTSADIQGMEDSLRRILKLGPASPSPVNGNLPAAMKSVPNYVGGRPPPMNGLHNGVMGS